MLTGIGSLTRAKQKRNRSVSFGPVFAAVLVVLLRTKLPIEKRRAFTTLVFAMCVVGMLILMLFMKDGTWSALDVLALCISWCAVAAYILVNGLRGEGFLGNLAPAIGVQMGGDDTRFRRPRSGPAVDAALDSHQRAEAGQAGPVSIQSDDVFTIGGDSTLDGQP